MIDPLSRLRSGWIGRIYARYLRQYTVFRRLAHSARRLGYLAGRRKWVPLVQFSSFIKQYHPSTVRLADACTVYTPIPTVFPSTKRSLFDSADSHYTFPEVIAFSVKNGAVLGGTNFNYVDGVVLCHDLYDFKTDLTSGEVQKRTAIEVDRGQIALLLYREEFVQISEAADFSDATAPNYAHWVTEVLPRLCLFCAHPNFEATPIVINSNLHENLLESLRLVAGPRRILLEVEDGISISARHLYLTTPTGYVPFGRKRGESNGHSHGRFNPNAFEALRSRLDVSPLGKSTNSLPRKIYVKRTSTIRQVLNSGEIEELMTRLGFTVVQPEMLTFSQQVDLFANAEVVVGPTGAGMANIVFCRRSPRIVAFIAEHPDMIYMYWQNIACASGNSVTYVVGTPSKHLGRGIHADFSVDTKLIENALRAGT